MCVDFDRDVHNEKVTTKKGYIYENIYKILSLLYVYVPMDSYDALKASMYNMKMTKALLNCAHKIITI